MAVENFNPFEMAQRQFDNVAKQLGLDEATCTLSRAPCKKLCFNVSSKIAKCLLLFCVVLTVSIFSSNKAIAGMAGTDMILSDIKISSQCFDFDDYEGCLQFIEFTYIKPDGTPHFVMWISGNINREDIFVIHGKVAEGDSVHGNPDYEVILQGNDLTIHTADELSSASIYDTRNGTLVRDGILIAPNSLNCITLQDIPTPYMLQIISAGQVTFQSQFIINYSNQLISRGK